MQGIGPTLGRTTKELVGKLMVIVCNAADNDSVGQVGQNGHVHADVIPGTGQNLPTLQFVHAV